MSCDRDSPISPFVLVFCPMMAAGGARGAQNVPRHAKQRAAAVMTDPPRGDPALMESEPGEQVGVTQPNPVA